MSRPATENFQANVEEHRALLDHEDPLVRLSARCFLKNVHDEEVES